MRIHEIIIESPVEEDFKSIKNTVAGAAIAGGLALGGMAVNQKLNPAAAATHIVDDSVKIQKEQDRLILAMTIWGEARSHGAEGMRAIAHVIKNREESDKDKMFGRGIKGVSMKRKQFSCWNPGDPNREAMLGLVDLDKASPDYKMWQTAYQIAGEVLSGRDTDPTNGALFYHTTGVSPDWSKDQEPTSKLANHLFYKTAAQA